MSSETMYFYLEWPPLVLLKRDKGHVESKMMMALIKRCIFPLDNDDDDDGDDDDSQFLVNLKAFLILSQIFANGHFKMDVTSPYMAKVSGFFINGIMLQL